MPSSATRITNPPSVILHVLPQEDRPATNAAKKPIFLNKFAIQRLFLGYRHGYFAQAQQMAHQVIELALP